MTSRGVLMYISDQTVIVRLYGSGMRVVPVFTDQHHASRLPFARQHQSIRASRPTIGILLSSQMRAGSFRAHVTDVKESGDIMVTDMLPAVPSSMTGLAVGQW